MKSINNSYRANWAFLLLSLYLLFLLPMSTYVSSSSFFQVSFFRVLVVFLAVSLSAGGLFMWMASLFPESWQKHVFAALFFACLVAFYNYNFHQYDGKIVGVDTNIFLSSVSVPDLLLYLTIAIVIFVGRKHIFSDRNAIAVFFMLANAAILSSQVLFSDSSRAEDASDGEPLHKFFEFSSDRNFLHIIFDGFQGSVLKQVLANEPVLRAKFPGFVFYPDALTSSEVTYLSLPASLSAKVFDGSGLISEYLANVGFGEHEDNKNIARPPLLGRLIDEGFRVDVLAAGGGRMPPLPGYHFFRKTDTFGNSENDAFNLAMVFDVTLVKIMPWRLKVYVYRNGNWLLSKLMEGDVPRANRAIEFVRKFPASISVLDTSPVYKFAHLLTPHGPWTTDENCLETAAKTSADAVYWQTRCTVYSIVAMVDQLRARGLYEKTAILIHGDHGIGQPIGMSSRPEKGQLPRVLGNINPVVLLKPFATTESTLQTSNKQIQLIDIPATVLDILSMKHAFAGRSMLQAAEPGDVVREFFEFEPNRIIAAKLDRVTSTKRFTVTGPITSVQAWKLAAE